jgi:hypothetical protein
MSSRVAGVWLLRARADVRAIAHAVERLHDNSIADSDA